MVGLIASGSAVSVVETCCAGLLVLLCGGVVSLIVTKLLFGNLLCSNLFSITIIY